MSANDPKYDFADNCIYNVASGEMIPEDEPCMVFRARDKHAHKALKAYYNALLDDMDVDDQHLDAVGRRIKAFRRFRVSHSSRMKTPDTELPNTPEGERDAE